MPLSLLSIVSISLTAWMASSFIVLSILLRDCRASITLLRWSLMTATIAVPASSAILAPFCGGDLLSYIFWRSYETNILRMKEFKRLPFTKHETSKYTLEKSVQGFPTIWFRIPWKAAEHTLGTTMSDDSVISFRKQLWRVKKRNAQNDQQLRMKIISCGGSLINSPLNIRREVITELFWFSNITWCTFSCGDQDTGQLHMSNGRRKLNWKV